MIGHVRVTGHYRSRLRAAVGASTASAQDIYGGLILSVFFLVVVVMVVVVPGSGAGKASWLG